MESKDTDTLTCIKISLTEIKGEIKAMRSIEENCLVDRNELFSRTNQIDKDVSVLKSKQGVVLTALMAAWGVIIGGIVRVFLKS